MLNQKVLDEANLNLTKMFGPKHAVNISISDIEAVYGRCVLGFNEDAKTKKGAKKGYLTGMMYLAPAKLSGIDICPAKSAGCEAACLFTAGRGRFYCITRARIIKTLAFHFDRPRFIATIKKSIDTLLVKAKNKRMTPVVRLNGTSDIPWELVTDIIQSYPKVQFYDYTKLYGRFARPIPKNYHLTFSMSEENQDRARQVLSLGGNVAAVFIDQLPKTLWDYPVTNADETDLRFLDKKGHVAGLKAKGKAKKDTTGFVIRGGAK